MRTESYFSFLPFAIVNETKIKNIFRKIAFRDDYLSNTQIFYSYRVADGESPETLARRFYNDPQLFWVIMIANKMKDYFYDWIVEENVLRDYAQMLSDKGILETGETVQEKYEELVALNDAKRVIKYLNPNKISEFIFELNKVI